MTARPCAGWRSPPVPWARTAPWIGDRTEGWPHRDIGGPPSILVMPPLLPGWLEQSLPPSVLTGSRPTPEIRLPSATSARPCPFAEADVRSRADHCDGETVVERGVADVAWRHLPASLEPLAALKTRGRVGGVDAPAPAVPSSPSPAPAIFTTGRAPATSRISGRVTTSAPPPSVTTQQAGAAQRIGDQRRGHITSASVIGSRSAHADCTGVMRSHLDPGELFPAVVPNSHVALGDHGVKLQIGGTITGGANSRSGTFDMSISGEHWVWRWRRVWSAMVIRRRCTARSRRPGGVRHAGDRTSRPSGRVHVAQIVPVRCGFRHRELKLIRRVGAAEQCRRRWATGRVGERLGATSAHEPRDREIVRPLPSGARRSPPQA